MNIVIVCGEIVSKVEYKFIYDRYKDSEENKSNYKEEKYNHISIARCKIKLENNSIIEVQGYDNMADYMYRNIKENSYVFIEGTISGEGKIVSSYYKVIPYNFCCVFNMKDN